MNVGMKLEAGELVLYHGRLAEMLKVKNYRGPYILELTDDGGLTWNYTTNCEYDIKPLQLEDECILDAITKAGGVELTNDQKRKRMAELWLADPQVGDVFFVEHDAYLLELTEFWDNGVIIALQRPLRGLHSSKKQQSTSFTNARTLRQWLRMPWYPVYRAAAFSTKRPDYDANPLLYRGVK